MIGLVVAKAPVPGLAKTRLAATVGEVAAAELAAAALLDTLDVCEAAYGVEGCALAWTGQLADAVRGEEITSRLEPWTVFAQRGDSFAQRLRSAHLDVREHFDAPVTQIGMDTPQVSVTLLREVGAGLTGGADAVLAPAHDGGWWALAINADHWVRGLEKVEMSTMYTANLTYALLTTNGARVTMGPMLRDVDTAEDAEEVSATAPESRFARCWRQTSSRR